MDKSTRAAIALAYEVDRDDGEGRKRRTGRLSGKRNTGKEKEVEGDGGEGGEEEEEEEEEDAAEGDEHRDAAPHGPRCMDRAGPATRNSCPTSTK